MENNWKKENHGGTPTQNKDKKYAVFIGRWQPLHFGHVNLIRQKLDSGTPVLIAIRDIEPDERNPLTTEQTYDILYEYYKEYIDINDVKLIVIPDIESVNYGRGVGYEVNCYLPPKSNFVNFISATDIRDSINKNNNTWKSKVPIEIHDLIIKYLT